MLIKLLIVLAVLIVRVGGDFEKGLAKMKRVVESSPQMATAGP